MEVDGPPASPVVSVEAGEGVTIVRIRGEVDLASYRELGVACEHALALGQPIRLDLGDVAFIDSTGVGYIARMAAAERTAGRRLPVDHADPAVEQTLLVSGLGDLVDFGR